MSEENDKPGWLARLRVALSSPPSERKASNRSNRPVPDVARRFCDELLLEKNPVDRKRLIDIVIDLSCVRHGQELVEMLLAHQITVRFDTRKGGAGYVPARKGILLNRTKVTPWVVLSFVHEATHARYHLTGTGSDVRRDGREEFAQNVILEEIGTRQAEIRVGRELVHFMIGRRRNEWKQYANQKSMQMWYQLVHGVPYARIPSSDRVDRDRELSDLEVEGYLMAMEPYLARFVEPYRAYEIRSWDISHRLKPPMDQQLVHEALSEAMSDQPNDVLYPKRPAGGLRPVSLTTRARPRPASASAWSGRDGVERAHRNPFV